MTKATFKKEFPKRLKKMRAIHRLTQKQMAEIIGITPAWLSHFESGQRLPSAWVFYSMTSYLGDYACWDA